MQDIARVPPAGGFLQGALGSATLIVAALFLPKTMTYAEPMRLALTASVFVFAVAFVWSFGAPLGNFVTQRLARRYEGAGDEITATIRVIGVNVARASRPFCVVGTIAIVATGLHVLSFWPQLGVIEPLKGPTWWIANIATLTFVAMPVIASKPIVHVFDLMHQLRQQAAIAGFDPSRPPVLARPPARDSMPVTITGDGCFRAAGIEWTFGELTKNVGIFGQTGAGKTRAVLNALFDGILRSTSRGAEPCAALVLDPKGEFREPLQRIMRSLGRSDDLIEFGPRTAVDRTSLVVWNPVDSADRPIDIAGRLAGLSFLQGKSQQDLVFVRQGTQFIEAAITLLRASGGGSPPDVPAIVDMMMDDARLDAVLARATDEGLQFVDPDQSAARQLLSRARRFVNDEWKHLPPNTRGSVRFVMSPSLRFFNEPPFHRICSGHSTFRIGECLDRGNVIYLDMDFAKYKELFPIVGTLMKLEFFSEVLRRVRKNRPSVFFCDEYQTVFTEAERVSDSDFFERSRGSNHANIVATQNLAAYFKGGRDEMGVKNFVPHLVTKIFLKNSNGTKEGSETNEWASSLFGEEIRGTVSTSAQAGRPGSRSERGGTASGMSQDRVRRVPPEAFSRLRQLNPGVPAESIVHMGGRDDGDGRRLDWYAHIL
jgi:hypothetical protein